MTPAEAAQVVALLAAAYPGARWSEATVGLYEAMLSDLAAWRVAVESRRLSAG